MSARLFCLLAMLLLGAAPVQAATAAFTTEAPIAYLIDMSSGPVLIDKNSSKKIPPASMTKMMTAYVIFDELAAKRLKLDQKFIVSKAAATEWSGKGSTMYLRAGQEVSVADLLRGLITVSGNDAAIALAEHIAGESVTQTLERAEKALHEAKAQARGQVAVAS